MKKLALTIAIVLGLSMTSFAQGGLFQRGDTPEQNRGDNDPALPLLPNHGETGSQDAPLGAGIAIMTAFGAAYLIGKKRSEE